MIVTRKAWSIPLTAMVLTLAAYSAQSGAKAETGDPVAGNRAIHPISAPSASGSTKQTTSAPASRAILPIEQGVYFADYSGSCARATEVFFYDGGTYGQIIQALPGNRMNSPRSADIEAHAIRRTGAAARGSKDYKAELAGFTRIWSPDDIVSEAGYPLDARGVKPVGQGVFILREGDGTSARGWIFDDTTYRKCAVSQLSPSMQATVRRYRPLLANGTPPRSSTATASSVPAIPARIPLAVGYYAYIEGRAFTCASTTSPWYFDGTRFWEQSDFTDPKHMTTGESLKWEMVAADRFRITRRDRDEDGRWNPRFVSVTEYVITGQQSFRFVGTVGEPLRSNENYQLCAPSQLQAKARWFRGTK